MAVDAEKNDAQAVERAEVHSDDGKQLSGEWQDVGSEQKMTWKTWIVIFVRSMDPFDECQILTKADSVVLLWPLLLVWVAPYALTV
jgi:hypothetical protein